MTLESEHFTPVAEAVAEHQTATEQSLEWLSQALHPFFYQFNRDEAESLAVLVNSLHRLNRLPYVRLADTDSRLFIAQLATGQSLSQGLGQIQSDKTLRYAEINTSSGPVPGQDSPLELLRFDYDITDETDQINRASGDEEMPDDLAEEVSTYCEVDTDGLQSAREVMDLLWRNNPAYVAVSHPERLARVVDLYRRTQAQGGVFLKLEALKGADGKESHRLLLGLNNPPQHNYLQQMVDVLERDNVYVSRAYMVTMRNTEMPTFLGTFYLVPDDVTDFSEGTPRLETLKHELYSTQILSSNSASFKTLVATEQMGGADASIVSAMIQFCHTNLAHSDPERFDYDSVERAFFNQIDVTQNLVELFHARFNPTLAADTEAYQTKLAEYEEQVSRLNTGRRLLDRLRRTIFSCAGLLVSHTLKTNHFVGEKHALAFRLDPAYLDQLDPRFVEGLPNDRPFRVTFFSGRSGCGYHIGFSDIARGGWRTVITQGTDNFIHAANTVFKENYVLAHTQHLKNKDIYEGGSKLVAILSTPEGMQRDKVTQYLYKQQFAFINAFLDLYVTENGKAKNPRVIDYYGEDEPIELGPDENMHDHMVEIIAKQAVSRGYILGPGVMSSKSVGINHKEFGVTSIGVVRFAEVVMQETLGIDMHQDAFSVKFTGGPDGDVAGNGMRLLLERCPNVSIKLVVDGSGAAYDPEGLNHKALGDIVLKSDMNAFDPEALNEGGFIIYRGQRKRVDDQECYLKRIKAASGLEEQWISSDEFYSTWNGLVFDTDTDLFIPAGGRPETIDINNVEKFVNTAGEPSAKVIVEGANSFISPDARMALQNRGVVIMRDASANKCGVISSSYEIIANLMLTEEEFLTNKPEYVDNVVSILNRLAEQEARVILARQSASGGQLHYTAISNQLSHEINNHYQRLFTYFQNNSQLLEQAEYRSALLSHLPELIQNTPAFAERVEQLPVKIQCAILASKLASGLVYFSDDDAMYADMIAAQLKRINAA